MSEQGQINLDASEAEPVSSVSSSEVLAVPLEADLAEPWALQASVRNATVLAFALLYPLQEGLRHRPRSGVLEEEARNYRLHPAEGQTPLGSRLEQTHVLLEAFFLALPQLDELQRVLPDPELLKEQGASLA